MLAGGDYVFDAPVSERWPVPDWVRVEKERLVYPSPPWKNEAPRPDRSMLKEFLLLEGESVTRASVETFARKWGVLGICRHGRIAGHPVLGESSRGFCTPLGYPGNSLSEAIERWEYWARYMRSLLNLAAAIESGDAGDAEDWKNLPRIPPRLLKRLGEGDLGMAREGVAAATTSLIAIAPFSLRLVPENGRYAMRLGPATHFSALFCSLAMEVLSYMLGGRLAVCSGCGRMFSAGRARTGKLRWCPRAACQRAARAEASRQYRRRGKK